MTTPYLFSCSLIIFSLALLSLTILYTENLYGEETKNTFLKTDLSRGSKATPKWYQFIAEKVKSKKIKVGFVHVENESFDENKVYGEEVEMVNIHFEHVSKDVNWNDLFPEWIDETLSWDSLKCPYIPMPKFETYDELDVVVANVPCGEAGGRNFDDVFRLQVSLVVANLLVSSGRLMFAVFVGSCGPMWEIFRCDDLLWHEDNSWIYRPDLIRLKQKVLMPVGSCRLAPPFPIPEKVVNAKEAYVSVLHSSEDYVCGAIVLAQSIIKSNSTKDLILLADFASISMKSLQGLKSAGWKVKNIKRIRSPFAEPDTYNEWNYSKLRIWQLTKYDKLIFIDSDLLILENIDEFFTYPQLSAAGNSRYIFNSGVMLIEPSECTFQTLMKQRYTVSSYNGGDQGFVNEMFRWWHRWPKKLNFLTDFDPMQEMIPEDVYGLHYLGLKPWMCHNEEYDCNWDVPEFKRFASDSAHRIWWQIHNSMPKKLRPHCSFNPEMEDRIQMRIAQARNATIFSRATSF